eukprot:gene7310-6570_t
MAEESTPVLHMHPDMPMVLCTRALLDSGFQAGYVDVGNTKKVHVMPTFYRELMLDMKSLQESARCNFEDCGVSDYKIDTDLFGYGDPKAEKFLTPHQGLPIDASQLSGKVGKHLFGVIPQFNNLEQKGKRTRSETWLRTEQRRWKETVLPFMRGAGVVKGAVFSKLWQVTDTGRIEIQPPEITRNSWVAVFLKGRRESITPEHRRMIHEHMGDVSAATTSEQGAPGVTKIDSEPKTLVSIEIGGPLWAAERDRNLWDLLSSTIELPDGKQWPQSYKPGGYASRADCRRFIIRCPLAEAREIVAAVQKPEVRDDFFQKSIEVFAWIEEEVHSNNAFAIAVPISEGSRQNDPTLPAESANAFAEWISTELGIPTSVAPARYFEVRPGRTIAQRRLFTICGPSPIQVRQLYGNPAKAREILGRGIMTYGHDGVVIGEGGNIATMAMPADVDASEVINSLAHANGLIVWQTIPLSSTDWMTQRVRVVFAPGPRPRDVFGTGVPAQIGERLIHVRIFTPLHQESADAVSRGSGGKRGPGSLSTSDIKSISEDLCKMIIAAETEKGVSGGADLRHTFAEQSGNAKGRGGKSGKGGQGGKGGKGEGWTCGGCSYYNFPHRLVCYKCTKPKPAGVSPTENLGKDGESQAKGGTTEDAGRKWGQWSTDAAPYPQPAEPQAPMGEGDAARPKGKGDTKLRPELRVRVRAAFQLVNFQVFFTNEDSKFGCMTGVNSGVLKAARCGRGESTLAIDIFLDDRSRLRIINSYWHPRPYEESHSLARKAALDEVALARNDHNPCMLAADINKPTCPASYLKALATGLEPVHPPYFTNLSCHGQSKPDIIMISEHLRGAVTETKVLPELTMLSDSHVPYLVTFQLRAIRTRSGSFSLRKLMVPPKALEQLAEQSEQDANAGCSPEEIITNLMERAGESRQMTTANPGLLTLFRLPCDEALTLCNNMLRRLKNRKKIFSDTARDEIRKRNKNNLWRMLTSDIPALKRLIRSELVASAPIVAVYDGQQLRTEASFVQDAMHRFWIDDVFRQQPSKKEFPSAPLGYQMFVQGNHPNAKRIQTEMEEPLTVAELKAAIHAMNKKGVTLDAPPGLLQHLGPKTLESFSIIFNALFLRCINIALPLHILLLMLPKSPDTTNVQKRRPIGI